MKFNLLLPCLLCCISLFSQKKTYEAVRTTDRITIDGVLDEPDWRGNSAVDFIQFEPNTNDPPSEPTEVFIRYDDEAIYVGARMWDSRPDLILRELTTRDNESNADKFAIAFDTYLDGLNAFAFVVNASGVQSDVKFTNQGDDDSWDAVWESAVSIDDKGWYAEMKIPYNAIRFAEKEDQVWGLQILRDIRRYREEDFWNPVDPNLDGFVNQFGKMTGLKNIKPPFRLSATPYVSAYYNTSHNPQVPGSFTDGLAYSAGMDIKLGLSDAFTLDMTLVPDFGQTVSDNQVLNLSPFEVFFEENRQFFTEGLELFNRRNIFYTRRVGGRPIHYFEVFNQLNEGEYVASNPQNTSLINASKISGRTSKGTGLGFFNGLTAREHAVIADAEGNERTFETSPLTNYNVAVIDQTLKNNSYVTLMNANTWRQGSTYDANTTGLFTSFNDRNQKYGARFSGAVTNKFYTDNTSTGFTYNVEGGKYSGNWTYSVSHGLESDNYDPNDLGFLFSPNEGYASALVRYSQYTPKNEKLNEYNFSWGTNYSTLYKPYEFTNFSVNFNNFWLYKSRDAFGYFINAQPVESRDYFEPRTRDFSKYLPIPANYYINAFFSSDYRKPFALDVSVETQLYREEGRRDVGFRFAPRIRFSDRFSVFLNTNYNIAYRNQGFVNKSIAGGTIPGLEEGQVLIGARDRQVVTNVLTARYIFTNNMGVDLRVRHYWDRVQYVGFLGLDEDGEFSWLDYSGQDLDGRPLFDNNVNIFNIDLQYQWRFAPGSDLFIVWKNSIFNSDEAYTDTYFNNLFGLFDHLQNNSISLRAVFFVDYQRLFQ